MTKRTVEPCACDVMTFLFPEYHYPHCKKNPNRVQHATKDKLHDESRALLTVSQPPTQGQPKSKKRRVKP